MLVGPRLILVLINEFEWTHGAQYDKSNTRYFLWNTGSRMQQAEQRSLPGTVEIPINSKANKQTDEPKLFCYINRWHKGAHALHNQRWHSFVLQSAVTPIVSGECSHHRDRAPMAARLSLTQVRLEAELDRLRAECQWDKIPASVEQLHAARFHEDGEWSSPVVFLPAPHPPRRSCVNWF